MQADLGGGAPGAAGMAAPALDRRQQRTRAAALAAFAALLMEQGYDAITVPAVAQRAGLGRSTLYEHFRSREALLEASVAGPLAVLAAAPPDPAALQRLLEHVRAHAGAVRLLLAQPLRSRIAAVLARHVAVRLRADGAAAPLADLRALAQAEGQLALLAAWVRSPVLGAAAAAAELARVGCP